MFKNSTILAALLLAGTSLSAQITITKEDAPKKFQQYAVAYFYADSTIELDVTGGTSNATWDLSSVAYTDEDVQLSKFESPSASIYKDSFPDADVMFQQDSFTTIFMSLDDDKINWLGAVTDADTTIVIKFDKPYNYLSLPITSTSKNRGEGSARLEFEISQPPITVKIINDLNLVRAYNVNGFGSLKMPDGKSYEVLRLKITEVDSSVNTIQTPLGSEKTTDVSYSYYYEFWAKGFGYPLASVEVDSADHKMVRSIELIDMKNTHLGINPTDNKIVTVYPNPANDVLFVNNLGNNQTVIINDISGKTLIQASSNHSTIDVSELNSGIYFLKVMSADGAVAQVEKIIIQ